MFVSECYYVILQVCSEFDDIETRKERINSLTVDDEIRPPPSYTANGMKERRTTSGVENPAFDSQSYKYQTQL